MFLKCKLYDKKALKSTNMYNVDPSLIFNSERIFVGVIFLRFYLQMMFCASSRKFSSVKKSFQWFRPRYFKMAQLAFVSVCVRD